MRVKRYKHRFVDIVPPYDQLEDDVLYVSLSCNVAVHKCACGCGQEVVTTIAQHRWKMTYDGKTITLSPSIGNWYFECQSHYFIRENNVVWAEFAPKKQRKTIKGWLWRFWGRFKRKY